MRFGGAYLLCLIGMKKPNNIACPENGIIRRKMGENIWTSNYNGTMCKFVVCKSVATKGM